MNTSCLRTFLALLLLCMLLCVPNDVRCDDAQHQTSRTSRQSIETSPPAQWFTPRKRAKDGGISGRLLQKNAVLGTHRPLHGKTPRKQRRDSSLTDDFDIAYDTETSHWNANPKRQTEAGETLGIHEQHRLRAYTKLKDSDALDIRAGPEVIFKKEKQRALDSTSQQPDSELGVGMQFEYNF